MDPGTASMRPGTLTGYKPRRSVIGPPPEEGMPRASVIKRTKTCLRPHLQCGVLGNIHDRYQKVDPEDADGGVEGYKAAILQWANGYYVAYTLMMTIAFGLILVIPDPRDSSSLHLHSSSIKRIVSWRPASPDLDAIVQLLYIMLVCGAMMHSTFGMVLTAEWNVRAPTVPAHLFENFLENLSKSKHFVKGPRFFEPRILQPDWGEAAGVDKKSTCVCIPSFLGFISHYGWDPFFGIDRLWMEMFAAAACYIYLVTGLLPALFCLVCMAILGYDIRKVGMDLAGAAWNAGNVLEDFDAEAHHYTYSEEESGTDEESGTAVFSSTPTSRLQQSRSSRVLSVP